MTRKLLRPLILCLTVIAGAISLKTTGAANTAGAPTNPFRKNVSVQVTDDFLIVRSNGIPDHTTGQFPNRYNPNTIREQDYTFRIPRHPTWSERITPTPMGPIGVAVNGVPFYNPYNAQGRDASKNEVFDECCGHPDPAGRYHYHIYPRCIHTSFKDKPGEHSELIGYAFDGYAIYGPNGEGGHPPADLDACNGHSDPVRGYHYHVTRKFPYIIGGYHGMVETANLDSRQRARQMMDALGAPGGPPDGGPGGGPQDDNGGPGDGGPGGRRPGAGGPGGDGPGAGGPGRGQGPPSGYHLLPRFAMENLNLTDDQRKKLHDLESEVKQKLKTILTADQYKQLEQMTPPPPRRQGGGGPPGRDGPHPGGGPQGGGGQHGGQGGGGPDGAGSPDDNGGPPLHGGPPGGGEPPQ